MIVFWLGVTTSFIIFILIVYHIHQFSVDSEFRSLLDEKQQPQGNKVETFKRKISLPDESIKWINASFSQILTHFRDDSNDNDIEKLNEALTGKLPPGFSFRLDTIGKNIVFDKPKLFYIQESDISNNTSDSVEEKEILQVNIPFKYNGLSFTIFSQIDKKNMDNKPIKIPLFEFDFRKIEAEVCASISYENEYNNDCKEQNKEFILNLSLGLEKDDNILDFDSSLIINDRKFTLTNCPIFGDFFKKLFQYLIIRRKLNFLINSSMINFDYFRSIIEKHNVIQTEVNI